MYRTVAHGIISQKILISAFFTPKERTSRLASASFAIVLISTVDGSGWWLSLFASLPPWNAWIILCNRQQVLPSTSLRIPHSSHPLLQRRVKYTFVKVLPKHLNLTQQVWRRSTASALFCRVTWVEFWRVTVCSSVSRRLPLYSVSQEEWTKLRESVPYVKLYRYNPKHLYPKLNSYGDNGHRKSVGFWGVHVL